MERSNPSQFDHASRRHPWLLALLMSLAVAGTAPNAGAQSLAEQQQEAVAAAVANVAGSVVQIRTIGGLDEVDRTLIPDGPTTGLVVSPDGWIVSSAFNFAQQPASILVTFASGEQAPATLVAKDHSRMLVLLKAQGVTGLPVPELVPTDDIRVGQSSIAVGRTFHPDQTNISVGIVSALDRIFGKVIQTDADVSTANYGGPLVDIRGRVLGVVVPIAPQTTSEVAGAEWYDSGIGFAVPLSGIGDALDRMKLGEDQRAGILGVSIAFENPHGSPAEIVAVPPTTPAGKAGLKKGDRIVEINGQPIETHTDLRFALGPMYAGEQAHVKFVRGDDTLERTIELAGELEPFQHAFLGILPMRDGVPSAGDSEDSDETGDSQHNDATHASPGIVVRLVYPGSPAAAAGVRAGDRIVRIDEAAVENVHDAMKALNATTPESNVQVELHRDDQAIKLDLAAGRLPTVVPSELPIATSDAPTPQPDAGPRELKLNEFPETCQIYVPPSHEQGRPVGVLIWLHAPGVSPDEKLFDEWRGICDRDALLLVVPTAKDPSRWEKTELEYLRRLSERVLSDYRVDPHRVVVAGQEGGGAMAYLLALSSRDLFTGLIPIQAALPRTVEVPPNDPTLRLAILAGLPKDGGRVALLRQGLKSLADAGYPVTTMVVGTASPTLTDQDREELARWIDTLDRF